MARILTKDIERLAHLRASIKELQEEEKEIKTRVQSAMKVGDVITRNDIELSLIEVQGAPDYKAAFIAVAGEDAIKDLPRSTYTQLKFKYVGTSR